MFLGKWMLWGPTARHTHASTPTLPGAFPVKFTFQELRGGRAGISIGDATSRRQETTEMYTEGKVIAVEVHWECDSNIRRERGHSMGLRRLRTGGASFRQSPEYSTSCLALSLRLLWFLLMPLCSLATRMHPCVQCSPVTSTHACLDPTTSHAPRSQFFAPRSGLRGVTWSLCLCQSVCVCVCVLL